MLPNKVSPKKYYWLKLKDNFFEREEIQLIESLPNGKEYVLILLKFMMKAINSDGRLVVKDVIPYNPQMLATVTHSNVDTVRSAIDIFIKFGLMSTLDDGTLYMNEVNALLGSETEFAAKKREYRQNLKNQPKQLTDNSKTQKDFVQDNVQQENRDKSSDIRNNTPLPPKEENGGGGSVWLQITKNLELVFNEDEQSAISRWAEYITSKQKSITVLQIETNLQNLAKLKSDGYDICSMITDTISAGYKWLLKPSAMYIKKAVVTQSVKTVKPHRFSNPEYIIPESPAEKTQLARYILSCYKKRINPKNNQPLTTNEIRTIDLHHKLFMSQDKNANGSFVNYVSWADYILQNEVHTGIPLVDQSINDDSSSLISSVA
ncbi:MAG: hypothetical protein EKK54_11665 [Neisseriaceae bacterium]|nr:MAG: hypothetical protein EKK54_11665 [Neisseriaceae bacterium]